MFRTLDPSKTHHGLKEFDSRRMFFDTNAFQYNIILNLDRFFLKWFISALKTV